MPSKLPIDTPLLLVRRPVLSTIQRALSPWADLTPGLSDYEVHGFRHFQVLTAPAMVMMLPSSAWIRVALQMSSQHPAIFHAITATGTLARGLTVLIHPSFPRPVLNDLAEEAVRQFRKAIRVLREYVDNAVSSSAAIEPILLACLLCVCFEAFRGRKSAAIDHARLGWNIVKNSSATVEMSQSPSAMFFNSVYSYHAGANSLFEDKEHHDSSCCSDHQGSVPHVFCSVEEATNCLTKLAKDAEHSRTELLQLAKAHVARTARLHGMLDAVAFCLAACLSRTIAISDLLQSRLEQLRIAHMQWRCAYALHEKTVTGADVEAHLVLRIRYFYSNFALATCRDSEETLADRFMGDFKDTLDCIERYLAVAERRTLAPQRSPSDSQPNRSLFFGFSILPSLHLIAHKCRNTQLRNRALHMLTTAHKQEGLEYSGTLGMYAMVVAEIEERKGAALAQLRLGPGEQPLQSVLPEEARIADCVITGQGARGIFGLTCARYVYKRAETQELELTRYEGGAVPLQVVSSWKLNL